MQGKKRSLEEGDLSWPPSFIRQCHTCNAWKLATDGDSHMIRRTLRVSTGTYWQLQESQWHCHACWQLKSPKDTKVEKDKDADKDEDKDDKDEDKDGKDEEDAPSKKKDAVGTSSTHSASI